MTTHDSDEKVKSIVRDALKESFANDITFDPIVVVHAVDEFPSPRYIGMTEWRRMYPKWKRLHPEVIVEAD